MSHISTSFTYIRRAPFQAIAAIFSMTVAFFVATLLSLFIYGSGQAVSYFETRPQVIAFLKTDAKEEAVSTLKQKLESDSRIKDVKYVTREMALSIYKDATKDNPILGELVSPSTFPSSLEFSLQTLDNAESVVASLKSESVVESVGFTANVGGQSSIDSAVDRLRTASTTIRLVGVAFSVILILSSTLVLIIVISMRITTRRDEIDTLRLLGARPGFIRMPITLEAILYALSGSFLGWLAGVTVVLYITPSLRRFFGTVAVLPRDTQGLFILLATILATELVIAIFVSLCASSLAISRAMPKRR